MKGVKIMFGGLTNHIKNKVIGKAIEKLGSTGEANLDGVGFLRYDYDSDKFSIVVDLAMKEKVREKWEQYHKNVNYQ